MKYIAATIACVVIWTIGIWLARDVLRLEPQWLMIWGYLFGNVAVMPLQVAMRGVGS